MSNLENLLVERLRSLAAPMQPHPTPVEPRLTPLAGYRCVLFDIYGTLLISGSGDVGTAAATDAGEAFTAALGAAGLQLTEGVAADTGARAVLLLHETIRRHQQNNAIPGVTKPEVDICLVWAEVLTLLAAENYCRPPQHQAQILRLAIEYESRINPVWPMPGAQELLQELHKRRYVLGVVSNAQFFTPLLLPALFDQDLAGLGIDPELCIWSYQLLAAKPSINLFKRVLDRLAERHGIQPGQVVYVGNDMLNDVWTATEAGCTAVLFAGDQRSLRLRSADSRCAGVTPHAVITELKQLAPLLTP